MLSRIGTVLVAGIGLFVVYHLYAGGNALLAAACLGGFGLAFFVYTVRRAYTYRYLFPGLAGMAMFIVLPLIYTIWLGFTNYSSRHLLTFDRATEVLLGEVYQVDSVRYQFTLHADGDGFRIVLRTGDDDAPAAAPAPDSGGSMFDNPADGSAGSAGSAAGSAGSAAGAAGSAGSATGSVGSAAGAAGSATGSVGSASVPPVPVPVTPPPKPKVFVTQRLPLTLVAPATIQVIPLDGSGFTPGDPLPLKDVISRADAIKALRLQLPDKSSAAMTGLRELAPYELLYQRNPDGSLTNRQTQQRVIANLETGYYEQLPDHQPVQPGFRTSVGTSNFGRVFTDEKFRGPFIRVFIWTIAFAGLTVVLSAALGMLLAELLSWDSLRFAGLYRVLLFLPYAVPGFISILVFKGLFNRNFGEINLILDALLGIRPDWEGNAMLARAMILIVNVWLGYPYFMLLCMGLQKSIPRDLYEASALAGAGPLTNFFKITWPLIRKPLTPLLVSAFAFNFNNFVLIYLLTRGRPDFLDTTVPAGETDILVSYTYRIAFEDSGQNFGLAAAISTLIFVMVAILSVINLRLTRANAPDPR
ncbi:MAG TPA: maltose ABC transporter permease MalF [Kofleriaceae bacterium]|jgi:maltose/maltodextrin transport system permease protein|nr:maltose ABC transporter permease MalF [Kofleriaceae bacterium]